MPPLASSPIWVAVNPPVEMPTPVVAVATPPVVNAPMANGVRTMNRGLPIFLIVSTETCV